MAETPSAINPLIPAELVIDHSVIADVFGRPDAFRVNADLEFERNRERYPLLRWAQQAFDNFRVVPPDTGICHQVNLEYLSRVVFDDKAGWPIRTLWSALIHTPRWSTASACSAGGSAVSKPRPRCWASR